MKYGGRLMLTTKPYLPLITAILIIGSTLAGCKSTAVKETRRKVQLTGTWKKLADIANPQYGCAAAVVNDKLHILGGTTHRSRSADTHQVYDPASNSWTQKAALPGPRAWPAVAVYDGKIFVFGGDKMGWPPPYDTETKTSWVYDPAGDCWSDIAELPNPRSYAAAVTVDNYIYIFGSRALEKDEPLDLSTYRYDPAKNVYERMQDLPEAAMFIIAAEHDNYIYAVHGQTIGSHFAEGVLKYDVKNDIWRKLNVPQIEKRRYFLTQHSTHPAISSRLFVLGGRSEISGKRSDFASYFDMASETFGIATPMPAGRCCGAAGTIGCTLYIAGGFWNAAKTSDVMDCKETWAFSPEK